MRRAAQSVGKQSRVAARQAQIQITNGWDFNVVMPEEASAAHPEKGDSTATIKLLICLIAESGIKRQRHKPFSIGDHCTFKSLVPREYSSATQATSSERRVSHFEPFAS